MEEMRDGKGKMGRQREGDRRNEGEGKEGSRTEGRKKKKGSERMEGRNRVQAYCACLCTTRKIPQTHSASNSWMDTTPLLD